MKENQLFAIFGNPVSHSRSPLMHNHVFKRLNFNGCYTRVHLEDGSKLKETFFALKLQGANVTVPHKEAAFKACDEVRGFAKEIGVVNTLINEDGRLIGYNTDADGFLYAVETFKDIHKVLIIGAGGTAKALARKFKQDNYDVTILNRSENNLQYFKDTGFKAFHWDNFEVQKYDLVVNTTSAGLTDENYPAPLELLTALLKETRFAADVIYGKRTPFLQLCKKMDITYKDGADMLLGQGVLANNYFTNNSYGLAAILEHMQKSFEY